MGISREKLWGEAFNITLFDGLLHDIYDWEEKLIWKNALGDSPHGQPWHTSFHGSVFPGEDDTVCGRAQVYNLCNPAPEKPIEGWLRAWFDLGLNLEHDWVRRLSAYGILLSNDVTGEDNFQTSLQDPEVWLTGSPDVIILPPFRRKAHVVEVKTTEHEKVLAMISDQNATPYSHKKYMRQLKLYIAKTHETFAPKVFVCRVSGTLIKNGKCNHNHDGHCDPVMIQVQSPDSGTLIYSSREEPLKTAAFYADYDPEFLKVGKEKLAKWKKYYLNDEIPPHIHEGESAKWSVGECQYCSLKKSICKPDFKSKTTKLSESALIEASQKVRPSYNYDETRAAVLKRWEKYA